MGVSQGSALFMRPEVPATAPTPGDAPFGLSLAPSKAGPKWDSANSAHLSGKSLSAFTAQGKASGTLKDTP